MQRGREIYNYRCYFCHGYNGDAKTLAATFLTPPPRAFTQTSPNALSRQAMLEAVRHGKPGSAMQSFASLLNEEEMAAVVDFVRQQFMRQQRFNTRYHTPENGWFNHEQYRAAYPFALGELPLDTPWEELSAEQRQGKQLFMQACVSCHDRALVEQEGAVWEGRPLSFPRNGYSHKQNYDALSSASAYALHERAPAIVNLTAAEQRGEKLFQQNCAFCHGRDGSGKNWIGQYLQPHPRNLRDGKKIQQMSLQNLQAAIREGVPGSAMPAWKTVMTATQIHDIAKYILRLSSVNKRN